MLPTVTTQQLVESGILETYLLGLASEEDQHEVQQMMKANPEIFLHLNELSADLETHFQHASVPPPPALRDVVELRANEQGLQKKGLRTYTDFDQHATQPDTSSKSNYVDVEVDNTHIRVHKYWRPAFIAVFVLSKIFLITGLYFYFKSNSQEQEILRLKTEINHTIKK